MQPTPPVPVRAPSINDRILVAGGIFGEVASLVRDNGAYRVEWLELDYKGSVGDIAESGGEIYLLMANPLSNTQPRGGLYRLDPTNGKVDLLFPAGELGFDAGSWIGRSSMASDGRLVYLSSPQGIWEIDPSRRQKKIVYDDDMDWKSGFHVTNGELAFIKEQGQLCIYDISDKEIIETINLLDDAYIRGSGNIILINYADAKLGSRIHVRDSEDGWPDDVVRRLRTLLGHRTIDLPRLSKLGGRLFLVVRIEWPKGETWFIDVENHQCFIIPSLSYFKGVSL